MKISSIILALIPAVIGITYLSVGNSKEKSFAELAAPIPSSQFRKSSTDSAPSPTLVERRALARAKRVTFEAVAPSSRLSDAEQDFEKAKAIIDSNFFRVKPLPEGQTYIYSRLTPAETSDVLSSQLAEMDVIKKAPSPPLVECTDSSCKISMTLTEEEYYPIQMAIGDFQLEHEYDYGQVISYSNDEEDPTLRTFTIYENMTAEDLFAKGM
jgi:hypothetical protein